MVWRHCQVLVARCLFKFLVDGTLKAYGVILEGTVNGFQSQHYLIGGAFSLQTGIGFLIAPLAGVFDQRVHPRIVASVGGFLAGLGYIVRAFLPSREPWQLFLCITLSGVGFGLADVITVISMKEVFRSSYATAFSVTQLPSYLGIAVMPTLLEYLQQQYGEQIGMGVFGVLSWTLILTGLCTPSSIKTDSKDNIEMTDLSQNNQNCYDGEQGTGTRPEYATYVGPLNETTDTEECNERSTLFKHHTKTTDGEKSKMAIQEYRKRGESNGIIGASIGLKWWICIANNHPEFLFLTFIASLVDHSFTSWSIFLVPYGEYFGFDSKTAVWLSTLGGIAGLVGRLFCIIIFCVNRMNLPIGLLMPVLCMMSAYVISLFYSSFSVLAVVSLLSGFGISVLGCVVPSWLPFCVCEYSFKPALYVFYVIGGIMTLSGGILTGAIIDISGSYRVSFASLFIVNFLQAIAFLVWQFCPSVPTPKPSASSLNGRSTTCCTGK